MRDAESLVKIKMRHVRSDIAGTTQAHLGVHVGTVHVHLTAVVMDEIAHLPHALLKDSVGGRVRDHDGGKIFSVVLGLWVFLKKEHCI